MRAADLWKRIPPVPVENEEEVAQRRVPVAAIELEALGQALAPVEGVQGVTVDIPARSVRVEYDEARIGVDRMKEILAEEEYPVA